MMVYRKRAEATKLKDLFKEKERLVRYFPDLPSSFEQFLKDLKEYEAMRESMQDQNDLEKYLLYGAHYEESE